MFYYVTVYNEPYQQPAEPAGMDIEGILKGLYRYAGRAGGRGGPAARRRSWPPASASPWALKAQQMLAEEWGVAADVWSATSWTELRRDALAADERALLYPEEEARVPYVTADAGRHRGPGRRGVGLDARGAGPDRAVGAGRPYTSLGADGFGFADTRGAARRFFHIDAESVVTAVLAQLAKRGEVKREAPAEAISKYQLHDVRAAGAGPTGGEA